MHALARLQQQKQHPVFVDMSGSHFGEALTPAHFSSCGGGAQGDADELQGTESTVAALYTLCGRAGFSGSELCEDLLLTLLWIVDSWRATAARLAIGVP